MDTLTDISYGAALSAAHLVKLLQVKQISRSTVSKLLELMLMSGIVEVTDSTLGDILLEHSEELDIAGITKEEIMKGFEKGAVLLEESNRMNIHIISYFDKGYPAMLRTIASSPLIIHVLGNYTGGDDISISLIGTRKPSRYGKRIAEKLSIHLAGHHVHVVTGMEAGCNNAAATACARSGGGLTTVLPTGLDAIYKKEYKQLAETVLKNDGCIMSEYMLNSKDLTFILSQRSRLIPALGQATIVVESDIDGETIHLAHIAKGYERKLFAFDHPEHMLNDKSRGNQLLISRGDAVGVKNIEDILSR